MPTIAKPNETTLDRIKLPFTFDVAKMQEEIKPLQQNQFVYYNAVQLRAPAHMVDTSLPFPPPANDYADGSWTDWLDTPTLKTMPYIASVIDSFRDYTTVNLVRLLRLAPMSEVKEHTDPTLGLEIERSMIRLTIPIVSNDQVTFYLNDKPVPLQTGECWYLRLTDPHRVLNHGQTERINMTIDVLPTDKMKAIILGR